jgi:hypothetical protein
MSTRIEDLDINEESALPPVAQKSEDHVRYEEVEPNVTVTPKQDTSTYTSYFTENNLIIFMFLLIASLPFLDTYLSSELPIVGKYVRDAVSRSVLKAVVLFVGYLFIQGQFK